MAGSGYEYSITASSGTRTYLVSGSNLAAVENRGKIVLLVDDSVAGALRGYIARLQSDLVGDGWTVLRHNVYRGQSAESVKAIIKADYDAFPLPGGQSEVKQVLLVGHVPVPYSGYFAFDGHPDHSGAWATDAYYADMDGVWTDQFINAGNNVIDDGRFDQEYLSGEYAPEIAVGRIDMYDLPMAGTSEVELLKRYFRKDHEYRVGAWDVRKRALLYSNWSANPAYDGGPLSAYKNLSALVGSDHIDAGYYFMPNQNHLTNAANKSYLWGWADGAGASDFTQFIGGQGYTSDGGGAAQFFDDTTSPDVVFNQLYGSYFPDWDRPNNFLRAAIAGNGYGLTNYSAIGAVPNFWHMGMGETIGDNLLFTQKGQPNVASGSGIALQSVNRASALMGDPTLRMAVVKPPTEVYAYVESGATSIVQWTPSADSEVIGYRVYRAATMDGPFFRISGTGDLTSSTTVFQDDDSFAGCVYMVRAVKLEESNTGTYFNLSQGGFSNVMSGLTVGIGRDSRAYIGSVALTFNEPVELSPTAVSVTRRGSLGGAAGVINFAVSTDEDGLSHVITLLDNLGQVMPFDDDIYDVQVIPGEITLAGTTTSLNDSASSHMFFKLAGDANGTGGVDFNDFLVFQSEFGVNVELASDSNNDTVIDFNDFLALQTTYGITLSF